MTRSSVLADSAQSCGFTTASGDEPAQLLWLVKCDVLSEYRQTAATDAKRGKRTTTSNCDASAFLFIAVASPTAAAATTAAAVAAAAATATTTASPSLFCCCRRAL
ncbi:hypothetical protein ElyMa_002929000 [Elysia marginata]|uniref:Secreted protein n=1 Tax=Elysia marginata TaxID=1093978 RepID=A0AAV4I7K9_9GAST|nr:hypothetical protein ElyMa_002929000 [Elysia marginata]